jgi:glycosyltransferase involved in cell wall biosynthesis
MHLRLECRTAAGTLSFNQLRTDHDVKTSATPRLTFTVFTPTYNRAHTLPRAYESLTNQTFTDFEWFVVDDGSTDATTTLMQGWIEEARFPIRYVRQSHAGKHVAENLALQQASGRFIANLDSDDWYLPHALQTFLEVWESIDTNEQEQFVGVVGLCADVEGNVIGTPFPADILDTTYSELRSKYAVTGDKAGCGRTNVVRQYPYPIVPHETLIMEALVYTRIARSYRIRCVNKILKVNEYQANGLTHAGVRRYVENPRTAALFFLEQIIFVEASRRERLRQYTNLTRFALHGGLFLKSLRDAPSKAWWIATSPIATLLYLRDSGRFARERRRLG